MRLRTCAPCAGATLLAYALVYRPWQLRWGATAAEVARELPGDELIAHPLWEATRAVDIAAGVDDVWPWLAQIGAHPRAGWYSYDWIDNGRLPSASSVRPDLQKLAVGERLPMTSGSAATFVAEAVDPGRFLVLANREAGSIVTTAFLLEPTGLGRSRLVHRVRFRVAPRPGAVAFALGMDVGNFVMSRRMLLGIRSRAERLARRSRGGPPPADHPCDRPLEFDLSVPIMRPPEPVYAALADVQALEPVHRSAGVRMTKSPPGPTHVGTRWDERVRLVPGLWMRVDSRVTEAQPPWRLGMDFESAWFEGHLDYELDETSTGCMLHQRETLALRPPLGPARATLDKALRPRLLDRLAELRDVVETRA